MQKPDTQNMILFTTFAVAASTKVSYLNIFKSLNEIFDITRIKQVYVPENKNYIGIEFASQDDLSFVKENFKMVGEEFIVHTTWIDEAKIHSGRIHWLPIYADKFKVGLFLAKYFLLSDLSNAKILLYDNVYKDSNVFEFKGLLRINQDLEKIPHIIEIDNVKALITIKGRKPLCTNCNKIGHIRKDCIYSYCQNCKADLLKGHDCSVFSEDTSYAGIMKNMKEGGSDLEVGQISEIEKSLKQGAIQELDNAWLMVKRNRPKTYPRKKAVSEKEESNLNSTDDVNSQNGSFSKNPELSVQLGKNLPLGTEKSIATSSVLKRKSDDPILQDREEYQNFAPKELCNEKAEIDIVDKNLYEVLTTDESETY